MNAFKRSQQGAALLVAMVMIFMISIMGVSVMRNSSLEHRMASNSIQAATVFQAAESIVEKTLNDHNAFSAAFKASSGNCDGTAVDWDVHLDGNDIDGLTTSSRIRFTRVGLAENYSSNLVVSLYFETLGTSSIPAANAQGAVIRGASRIVPQGPTCQN